MMTATVVSGTDFNRPPAADYTLTEAFGVSKPERCLMASDKVVALHLPSTERVWQSVEVLIDGCGKHLFLTVQGCEAVLRGFQNLAAGPGFRLFSPFVFIRSKGSLNCVNGRGSDVEERPFQSRVCESETNWALEVEEDVDSGPSGAKCVFEIKAFNAALEALLHPKLEFFRTR